MLVVKLMGPENLSDGSSQKTYRLLANVATVNFKRGNGKSFIELSYIGDDEVFEFELEGNVYIMNEDGKTISSFGCAPIQKLDLENSKAFC